MLFLEIFLFIAGIVLLRKVSVQVGGMECRTPRTVFAGIILAIQLPMAVGMGFAIGGAEGIKAKREGVDPAEHTARVAKSKYWFVDMALVGTAAGLAGLIVLSGLRPITYEPPPPDEPIGITDHRAVMREKWAENDRIARARHRQQTEYDDEPTLEDDSTARLTSRFRD